jgi:hypothetical protein
MDIGKSFNQKDVENIIKNEEFSKLYDYDHFGKLCCMCPYECLIMEGDDIEVLRHFIYNNEYKVDDILEGSCKMCKNIKTTLAHLICSYVIDSNFIKDVLNKVQNINMKDSYNCTFLHYVCYDYSDIELIKFIVSRGADVNATTTDGERPIHYASNEDIIELLINHGATYDINEEIFWKKGSYDQLSYMNKIRNEEITMNNKFFILYHDDMSDEEKIKLIGEIQNKI